MRQLAPDRQAVSPIIATILLVAIVVIAAAVVAVLASEFRGQVKEGAPVLGLTTDADGTQRQGWTMRITNSVPRVDPDTLQFFVRTPQNGTLTATPTTNPFPADLDFYWSLGASAGDGLHLDNGTSVGSYGGFRLRLVDNDGDGRLGGGDRVYLWYDGDGDQSHQNAADDFFPSGVYTFEVKHVRTDSYLAIETRPF